MAVQQTILHLAGSVESDFYHSLSLVYAKGGLRPERFDHLVAIVGADGW